MIRLKVAYDTHPFPSSDESCDTEHEADGGEHSPAPTSVAESDEDSGNNATNDAKNTEAASKDNTRAVSVANAPANEIGVCLMTERPFDGVNDVAECRGVGGVGQSVKEGGSFFC